jgi:hypothetical protein
MFAQPGQIFGVAFAEALVLVHTKCQSVPTSFGRHGCLYLALLSEVAICLWTLRLEMPRFEEIWRRLLPFPPAIFTTAKESGESNAADRAFLTNIRSQEENLFFIMNL